MLIPENILKKDIVNFFFVLSFPLYGVAIYLASAFSPSAGYAFGCLVYCPILLFYGIDALYKRTIQWPLSGSYVLIILFYMSTIVSFVVAVDKQLPAAPLTMLMIRSAFILLAFHAFIVVYWYNGVDDIMPMLLKGLTWLLLINIGGYYVLGISNATHSIEGRVNFPFLDGFYSGAGLIAVINLILLYRLMHSGSNRILSILYFCGNLFFFFYINSRLVTLVLILVMILMITRLVKSFIPLFLSSLFVLPLLLSGGLLVFQILSLPVFQALIQRSELADVITFHGRSFLWQSALNWLAEDQRGVLFGNGYKGHYFLDLLGEISKFFDIIDVSTMHLHSTSLEIIVNQGIVGLLLFLFILFKAGLYLRKEYQHKTIQGALYPVIIFFLFIAQVDTFLYLENLGGLLFAFIAAGLANFTETQNETMSVGFATGQRLKMITRL